MTCLIIYVLVFTIFNHIAAQTKQTWHTFCPSDTVELNWIKEGKGKIEWPSRKISYLIHLNTNCESGIELLVKDFCLNEFFLVIQGVLESSDTPSDDSNVHFVSGGGKNISETLKFRIPFTKTLFIEVCPENFDHASTDVEGRDELTMELYRIEMEYEEPLPDDLEHQKEKESYEIQLRGKEPNCFNDVIFMESFREAVKNIAQNFSEKNNLELNFSEPASKMVTIHAIHSCPREWPDNEICASVQHSVFASRLNSAKVSSDYELTADHLKQMWDRSANPFLQNISLCIYQLPDRSIAGMWLIITLLPFAITLITFPAVKIYKYFMDDMISGNQTNVKTVKRVKKKKTRLVPNANQTVPDFMLNQAYDGPEIDGPCMEQNYYAVTLLSRYRISQEDEYIYDKN